MEAKIYCPKCGDFRPYEVKEERETYPVKNEPVEIMAKVSYCKCCGEMLWNEELDDVNLKMAFDVYKNHHDLLTSEKVKRIREKYGLSQALFSKLLGLGEKTITRYENGSIQDVAHNSLLLLADKPDALLILLKANRRFLTDNEYEKAYKAINTFRARVVKSTRFKYTTKPEYKIETDEFFGGLLSDAS